MTRRPSFPQIAITRVSSRPSSSTACFSVLFPVPSNLLYASSFSPSSSSSSTSFQHRKPSYRLYGNLGALVEKVDHCNPTAHFYERIVGWSSAEHDHAGEGVFLAIRLQATPVGFIQAPSPCTAVSTFVSKGPRMHPRLCVGKAAREPVKKTGRAGRSSIESTRIQRIPAGVIS
ncbi:hypothetical protein BCR34DRAFT_136365 [Clohesyomyces aquaticus]|uniref:Uncharacterized protein n=1 Tax=Clohesyomyces aquaticus TaxID=1231657 RepID=A0A1Y2A0U3_9PLEO|nr:hypothetical protein BCR34DRAFT_136365 [Clohesyomyces aquaticus]